MADYAYINNRWTWNRNLGLRKDVSCQNGYGGSTLGKKHVEEVIVNKYGLNENWVSNSNIVYKVGNGTKILLRKENWNGNEASMDLFHDLFSLCTNPEETVVRYGLFMDGILCLEDI
ncbi:hypothetical protein H5410_008307 [Solanum commersonii]|uniref:Uncharacterized protein n=1 Tax=Solanum commersonii TaxID=4109 RepID=A0A9J6AFA3_SOLCO|nr:hypothetical protein H5410_008307 [Solanum commersonii]